MPTLLSIVLSPRGDYSVSRALSAKFVDAWKAAHPDGNVVTRDLCQTKLPFVDLPWILGAYTPAEQHSPEMKQALEIGNELIAELQQADHILIATPMYNFSTPAILKAYLDHVIRVGVTFSPSYEGLLKNKTTNVIIASAGTYTPGAYMEKANFEVPYLTHILGFIGLSPSFVLAGGTSDIDQGKTTREALVAQFTPEVEAAAKR